MEKLNKNETKANKVIPTINSLMDEVAKLQKDLKLIKEVMLDNFENTGYLEDLELKRKKSEKSLDK